MLAFLQIELYPLRIWCIPNRNDRAIHISSKALAAPTFKYAEPAKSKVSVSPAL